MSELTYSTRLKLHFKRDDIHSLILKYFNGIRFKWMEDDSFDPLNPSFEEYYFKATDETINLTELKKKIREELIQFHHEGGNWFSDDFEDMKQQVLDSYYEKEK